MFHTVCLPISKANKGDHEGRPAQEIQFNLENELLKNTNKNKKRQGLW